MSPNHLILCRPLLFLPSIFPSIRVFFNESALHIRWPKYWSTGVFSHCLAMTKNNTKSTTHGRQKSINWVSSLVEDTKNEKTSQRIDEKFSKHISGGFLGESVVMNIPANAGDTGSVLGREDPTCCRATKPMHHNYWAGALEPGNHNHWSSSALQPVHTMRGPCTAMKHSPRSLKLEKGSGSNKDPVQAKEN